MNAQIKTVRLASGSTRYRFTFDVPGATPRTQRCRSFRTYAEAESALVRIRREIALGVYVDRVAPLKERASAAGRIVAEDLFRSGRCTPNCMHAWNERYERLVGCECPCGGRWHGALRGATVASVAA